MTPRRIGRNVRGVRGTLAIVLVVAGCGDDDGDGVTPRPVVGEIGAALDAVDEELGGPQDYYEVNATPQLVNLFVATDDGATATAYVVLDGELQPPAPPRDVAGGETFRADAVDFDPDSIFVQIDGELERPVITQFVIVGGPGGAVQYSAIVTSSEGGMLDVLLGADGAVLGVDPG